jgi:hypothetical protein
MSTRGLLYSASENRATCFGRLKKVTVAMLVVSLIIVYILESWGGFAMAVTLRILLAENTP